MSGVRIRGDGVAARCAAHLLARAGLAVEVEPAGRPRVPCLLLSQAAQDLIRDVFENQGLLRDAPRVRTRIVRWGASCVSLPHSAVVVSEEELLAALPPAPAARVADAGWTIITTSAQSTHSFGARMASVTPVPWTRDDDPAACRIESLESGWRFLIPARARSGWLISVCGAAGEFPVAPRIAARLCGPGWLACGSAALAFDPLCGDGTAHAVREAILASAVIRAASQGEDPDKLLAHYQARLTAGFQRHLLLCREYYASGGMGEWWRTQRAELDRGLEWCAGEMRDHAPFLYRLHGFELRHLQPGTANDPIRVRDDDAPLFK